MSDDVRDAGLVAMISSILGGNKRAAESVAPPPLIEVPPPTAPTNGFELVEPPAADTPPARLETNSETTPRTRRCGAGCREAGRAAGEDRHDA